MTKQEFINTYATKTNQTKKASGEQVDAFLKTLKEGLVSNGKVVFVGDFSLEVVPTKERKGVNPQTGEKILIPSGKKIKFKAGKIFKNLISG